MGIDVVVGDIRAFYCSAAAWWYQSIGHDKYTSDLRYSRLKASFPRGIFHAATKRGIAESLC
jgi:hypothetical protein